MNTQSDGRPRPIATAGLLLLAIGLLLAVFYAVMCRYDDSAHQLSDFAFVVLGVSLQLVGLGFIIWKK
jgi:protein-S-isoprenylcysteine O-methyltransferase Ste14